MEIERFDLPALKRTDITTLYGTYLSAQITNGNLERLSIPSDLIGTKQVKWTPADIESLIQELNEVKRIAWPNYINASTSHGEFEVGNRA